MCPFGDLAQIVLPFRTPSVSKEASRTRGFLVVRELTTIRAARPDPSLRNSGLLGMTILGDEAAAQDDHVHDWGAFTPAVDGFAAGGVTFGASAGLVAGCV